MFFAVVHTACNLRVVRYDDYSLAEAISHLPMEDVIHELNDNCCDDYQKQNSDKPTAFQYR